MKKICLLSAAVTALAISPIHAATNAEIIAEMASQCWVMPEDPGYQKASAVFEVEYNELGELTDVVTIEYQPVRKAGEIFALSALEAITTCAVKTNIKSRIVRVVMKYSAPGNRGILNMKKSTLRN